jgi:hypothetical protein
MMTEQDIIILSTNFMHGRFCCQTESGTGQSTYTVDQKVVYCLQKMLRLRMRQELHLNTLLHWFAHNYFTEFDGIVLSCKFYFLHINFRKNYACDTCVI